MVHCIIRLKTGLVRLLKVEDEDFSEEILVELIT